MNESLPNIIYIICHDLGRYLGCYGRGPIATPNLDRMAGEGVLFTNHFCTASSCSPSRGSVITGRYPQCNGLMGLVNRAWELPLSEKTTPQYLNEAGYETYLFGLQHERKDRDALGYDHTTDLNDVGLGCRKVSESLVRFIEANSRIPFYASVGFHEPHRPFGAANIEDHGEVYLPPYLPDNLIVRREMAGFARLVERVDRAVGAIIDALEGAGLSQSTLLVFTTDHGIDMPRAKGTLYDPGIETALIMRWPGTIEAGTRSNVLLSNVDHLPTLLDVAGLETPDAVQGRSFWPLVRGTGYSPRSEIFAEKTQHSTYDPIRCIRTETHKYIHNFGEGRRMEIPADAEMNTVAAVGHMYPLRRPMTELYDLADDPSEMNNLSGTPQCSEIQDDLHRRLWRWMEQTDDPLLKGILPIPRFF